MKKITAKAIALFTALLILMTALPMSATAATADGEPVSASGKTGDVNWSLSGTELTISGYGRMADYVYDYSSKTPWGYDITSVNILPGVENIGKHAFKFCSKLTSVTIGNNVESIGESAFFLCTAITDISLPDSVAYIGDGAFGNCTHMETIRMPAHLDHLGYSVFNTCSALKSLDIPEGVTTVPGRTFFWCRNLEHVTVPGTVTSLSDEAFATCYGLKELELPESITYIGTEAFSYCYDLESVNIPSGVTTIPDKAFLNCTSLTTLEIPDQVMSIGEAAFSGCTSLSNIGCTDFADAVQHAEIGVRAFYNTAWFSAQPVGVYYIGDAVYGTNAVEPTALAIRDGATSIMDGAFRDCPGVGEITIPDTITAIPAYAFNNCDSLLSITLPESITKIGDSAFADSSALETAIVSGSVGANAFYECLALKNVAIKGSGASVGANAFYGCKALEKIRFADSVTSIGKRAFYNCLALKRIVLPKSLKTMADEAFGGCSGLEAVLVPSPETPIRYYYYKSGSDVWSIEYVFKSCPAFKVYGYTGSPANTYADTMGHPFVGIDSPGDCSVENDALTVSGSGSMANYSESDPSPWTFFDGHFPGDTGYIASVTVEYGVTSVGNCAFSNLTNLKTVSLPGTLTAIGDGAFEGCAGLETINMPNSLTKIGDSGLQETVWYSNLPDGMLYFGSVLFNCKGAAPAVIETPYGTTGIAGGSFRDCEGLERLELAGTVTHIGANAFTNCPDLTAADFSSAATDIAIDAGAFTGCPDLVFSCYKNTPAYQYAQSNSIPCNILGGVTGDCIWLWSGDKLIIKGNGAMADYTKTGDIPWDGDYTEVVICNGVTHIGSNAFCNSENLQKLAIPQSVTSVSKKYFSLFSAKYPVVPSDAALTVYIHENQESLTSDILKQNDLGTIEHLGITGDQNSDGKIDVRDVTALQRHLAELHSLSGVQYYGADTNNDGITDITDATHLQMYLAEYDVTLS